VEVASGSQGTPGPSTIVVQPVGEEALKSGTPVGEPSAPPAPGAGSNTPGASATDEGEKAGESASAQGVKKAESTPPPEPEKKKKSLFKKIINPF
jgi:hypothetical protein